VKLNIRVLHIHYLAWRLPISGPQGWSLAAAKSPCGSWGAGWRIKKVFVLHWNNKYESIIYAKRR
jgi:hypothetical protein